MHNMKTAPPIVVTDGGIDNCSSDMQLLKAFGPITCKDDGFSNDTSTSDLQSSKSFFPIEVTEEGIVICVNLKHSWKEYSPIEVTEEEIEICVNDEQSWKALFPIEVIEDGIDILFKTLLLLKMFSSFSCFFNNK